MSDGGTNCGKTGTTMAAVPVHGLGTIVDAVFGQARPLAVQTTYAVTCHSISLLLVVVWSYIRLLNYDSLSENPPCQCFTDSNICKSLSCSCLLV